MFTEGVFFVGRSCSGQHGHHQFIRKFYNYYRTCYLQCYYITLSQNQYHELRQKLIYFSCWQKINKTDDTYNSKEKELDSVQSYPFLFWPVWLWGIFTFCQQLKISVSSELAVVEYLFGWNFPILVQFWFCSRRYKISDIINIKILVSQVIVSQQKLNF